MKSKTSLFTIIACVIISISLTGAKEQKSLTQYIPEGASCVLYSASLEQFVNNLDSLIDESEIDFKDKQSLEDIVSTNIVDLKKEVVFAVYPDDYGSYSEASILVLCSFKASDEEIEELLSSSGKPYGISKIDNDYMAVSIGNPDLYKNCRAFKNLYSLTKYYKSSVSLWFDAKQFPSLIESTRNNSFLSAYNSYSYLNNNEIKAYNVQYTDEYQNDYSWDDYGEEQTSDETPFSSWYNETETDNDEEQTESPEYENDEGDTEDPNVEEEYSEEEYSEEEYPEEDYSEEDSIEDDYVDEDNEEDYSEKESNDLLSTISDGVFEKLSLFLKDIDSFELTMTAFSDNIWLHYSSDVNSDSELSVLAKKMSKGDSKISYLDYCNSNSLFSSAWSLPINEISKLYLDAFKDIIPSDMLLLNIQSSETTKYLKMNGALSFDFSIGQSLLESMKTSISESDARSIIQGLGIEITQVNEISERQRYRQALLGTQNALKETPIFDLNIEAFRKAGRMNNIPYDHFTYKVESASQDNENEVVAEVLSSFLENTYIYDDENVFFSLGLPYKALERLPEKTSKDSLSRNKDFRVLKAGASINTRGVMYLSTKRFVKIIDPILDVTLPEKDVSLYDNFSELRGALLWLDCTDTNIGFGLSLSAEDLKMFNRLTNL